MVQVPHFLLAAAAAAPALGALVEKWWDITYVQANPDGLFERRVVGVNGTWPPPPIELTKNDTLRVHATNKLDQPTTLHHHGMFFNKTTYFDGAMGVSQCGIPPGQTFTYDVDVADWNQWGTYWVHAHASGHYVDGLRAPVVIHNTPEVHTYDDEFTIVLGDWYHDQHADLLKQFISRGNPGGAEPVPDSALIYFTHNGAYLPSSTDPKATGLSENATLPFEPGKTYRLRIVNTSAFSMFFFYIDGHDMRVIEVDGTDVEEYPISLLSLTVAQRYSVLVTTRNDTSSNFLIHANMDTDMFDVIPDALNPNTTATVVYDANAPTAPGQDVDAYFDTPDIKLVPIVKEAQQPATHQITLNVLFDTLTDGTNRAMFNNITYNPPIVPTVFSELSLGQDAVQAQLYGPSSFVLNKGDVVELKVFNFDAGKHPFHLHGHKFQIVNKATDFTSDDPELNPPVQEGQANPVRRDTVQIPSMGSATLRFVADNPGAWLFHCHIEWHLEAGLAVTLLEAPLEAQQIVKPPQFMFDQCAALGVPTSGNAAGHQGSDLSGLKVGPFLQNLGWHSRGIGALAGCILAAVLGMASVAWYAWGGHISDEEVEEQVRQRQAAKTTRPNLISRLGRFTKKD
ncbi:laccase [Exidia glandulosa HHB12029]|uniref:Laccase n=1 Tax=Exidia glandulosa HHB12029 TaxID=1314781 RepID=A0A165BL63_EXIGL|nr:laccase [Exidia glandulosa HHB12029]